MGGKGSRNMESNRPESGGANKDEIQEKSGILDREKEKFAEHDAEKQRSRPASEEKDDEEDYRDPGYGGSGKPEDRSFDL